MSIAIRSNIAALNAERRLTANSSALEESFVRLSSGLRVNSASDDAAGLSIASSLRVDSRVFSQAIRNGNDALSTLSIAEGALRELSNVVIRLKELAESAANGTLAEEQRQSLDLEAESLVREYNRIIETTSFNDLDLLTGELESLTIQLGYGTDGQIVIGLGGGLERDVGSGEFSDGTDASSSNNLTDVDAVTLGDIDGDGYQDLVMATTSGAQVRLGNGDGTFGDVSTVGAGTGVNGTEIADMNGDGNLDLILSRNGNVGVALGDGSGGFGSVASTGNGAGGTVDLATGDFNGDGATDIVVGVGTGDIIVHFNANDGTGGLSNPTTVAAFGSNPPQDVQTGDFDGDGVDDIVAVNAGLSQYASILSNGDGTFTVKENASIGTNPWGVAVADFDNDGNLDFASAAYGDSTVNVQLGNGDGTFTESASYVVGTQAADIATADINDDGVADLIAVSYGSGEMHYFEGNEDGTFQDPVTTTLSGSSNTGLAIADLDSDGVLDVVSGRQGATTVDVMLGEATQVTTAGFLDLTSQASALEALDTADTMLQRLTTELGSIGSTQARLETALGALAVTRENYIKAESSIMDVDVARETARLVASQIRQQAAASVLTQANQVPSLALELLRF